VRHLGLLVALGLELAFARVAAAQQPAASATASEEIDEMNPEAACRLASRVLATGQPTRLVPTATRYIVLCNDQAPAALASGLRRLRTSNDTVAFNAMLRGALYVRDAGFFAAAYDMAVDPGASAEARAAGFLIAALQLQDRIDFGYGEIVSDPALWICPLYHSGHSLRSSAGTPLPSGAASQLRAAGAAVLSTSTTPRMVSMAAQCADIVANGILTR
jgi:hypothetical protein